MHPWLKIVSQLWNMLKKSHKRILHQDKTPKTIDIQNEIVEWKLMNRSQGVSISSWEVLIKNVA